MADKEEEVCIFFPNSSMNVLSSVSILQAVVVYSDSCRVSVREQHYFADNHEETANMYLR